MKEKEALELEKLKKKLGVIDIFDSEVTPVGNSGHVFVGKEHIGKKVTVLIHTQ